MSDITSTEGGGKRRILLVDDDPQVRRGYSRLLEMAGYEVQKASGGREAAGLLKIETFDVIVSDLMMPGMDGLQFLRVVREHDLDVPVLLMTASPSIETAARAVEYGALRYLIKPVPSENLREAVDQAVKLHEIARLKREAVSHLGAVEKRLGDRASLEAGFDRALQSLWMAYQPIVNTRERRVIAYEALVRSNEGMLPHPGALFSAAERLGRLNDLGRAIRASIAKTLAEQPVQNDVFINLHTRDLADPTLFARNSVLAPYAQKVVFEITERAALEEIDGAAAKVAELRKLGFRVAIDDLGAGYAGLTSFALLAPEVVKLDMSLIRGVHKEPLKQKLIRSISALCKDLRMLVVSEGVELVAERDMVSELGCEVQQGYLFAKPGKPFPEVTWSP